MRPESCKRAYKTTLSTAFEVVKAKDTKTEGGK